MYDKPFTVQAEFDRMTARDDFTTITVVTNGGTITVELLHDPTPGSEVWHLSETFTSDGAYVIRPGSFRLRITPTGGAEFNVSKA